MELCSLACVNIGVMETKNGANMTLQTHLTSKLDATRLREENLTFNSSK